MQKLRNKTQNIILGLFHYHSLCFEWHLAEYESIKIEFGSDSVIFS